MYKTFRKPLITRALDGNTIVLTPDDDTHIQAITYITNKTNIMLPKITTDSDINFCICILDCFPSNNKLIIDDRADLTISAAEGNSFTGSLIGIYDQTNFGIDLTKSKAVTIGTPGSLSVINCYNNSKDTWRFSGKVYTNTVSS
jgi:hypothetical protein